MAKVFDFTLLGDAEINKFFKTATRSVQRMLVRTAMKAAAVPVYESAKAKAPVDTGRLRDSMRIGRAKTKRYGVEIRIQTGSREELGIDANATGYYPMSQETGWTDESGRQHAAQPYMRPALYENKEAVLSAIKSEFKHYIASIKAGKVGRGRKIMG